MIELSSKQRKVLEKHAQRLQSVVIVGQGGVTEAVEKMTDSVLAAHELVKISFNEFKEQKRELAATLAEKCQATLVRVIGNKAILYRPAKNAGERKYEKLLDV
ncbi:MAG: YhbY family RNA-binding protein [Treponema sp.]|nr:YhbY family RNA-binding protein [Treponema sp.]